MSAPIRVIQWTTGNVGRRSLHAILSRPDLELVGVYAHGPDKIGVDASTLAGFPEPSGVLATDDVEALIALKPDACVYNPLWSSTDELVALLEAGINVCTTAGWINGTKLDPAERARVEDACERGGSSIYGSGAHPGLTNAVALALTRARTRRDQRADGRRGSAALPSSAAARSRRPDRDRRDRPRGARLDARRGCR